MAITVNTNISSINAQRQLTKSTSALDKAMARLSSGLRINSAADDAAGLAISTGITSQTNGLTQAEQNANDGLSVVGTAEGALDTQTTILQRIRELAVQASNDINSADDRDAIQEEIDAQVEELTRLGNTTTFNGINLLDGSFDNKELQVGAYANQTISVSLDDFRASAMGYIATTTGTAITSSTAIAGGGDFVIKSYSRTGNSSTLTTVGLSSDDGVSFANSSASAIAKANAINAVSANSGVTATVNATSATITATAAATMGGASTNNNLTINGTTIFDTATTWTAANAPTALTTAINAKSGKTGVTASVSGTNVVLSAEDGRNITMATTTAAYGGVTTTAATTYGSVSLSSSKAFSLSSSLSAANFLAVTGFSSGSTIALDTDQNVSAVDVTTQDNAETAIQIVDSALSSVSSAQSSLGALSNRLTNTISNIEVANENLSAANSRIQDTDFAAETANMTRAQIIQQSSVAVLTQANSRPQIALTLLGA
ncbi:TPA: flagellin [Candidatus Sumerlaeota bacterium]|nr:flagellin [Candidatus Sumerlaeota bacterium]